MPPSFYNNPKYKQKQSEITKRNWSDGKFDSLKKPIEKRFCRNSNCEFSFDVKPYDPKRYCSKNCAATVNNSGRQHPLQTKQKISRALLAYPNPFRGLEKVARKSLFCQNPKCQKEFKVLPYLLKTRRFCSNACAMVVIGGQTTSPKASKGKAGIRKDIHPIICFYSTWEANIARVFNLVGIKWQYSPRIFDLGNHTYRPDFYLPETEGFIEVKNFMGEYSQKRDQLFRQKYPYINLDIISKVEYEQITEQYKPLIDEWE